jgi:hypothetical protein
MGVENTINFYIATTTSTTEKSTMSNDINGSNTIINNVSSNHTSYSASTITNSANLTQNCVSQVTQDDTTSNDSGDDQWEAADALIRLLSAPLGSDTNTNDVGFSSAYSDKNHKDSLSSLATSSDVSTHSNTSQSMFNTSSNCRGSSFTNQHEVADLFVIRNSSNINCSSGSAGGPGGGGITSSSSQVIAPVPPPLIRQNLVDLTLSDDDSEVDVITSPAAVTKLEVQTSTTSQTSHTNSDESSETDEETAESEGNKNTLDKNVALIEFIRKKKSARALVVQEHRAAPSQLAVCTGQIYKRNEFPCNVGAQPSNKQPQAVATISQPVISVQARRIPHARRESASVHAYHSPWSLSGVLFNHLTPPEIIDLEAEIIVRSNDTETRWAHEQDPLGLRQLVANRVGPKEPKYEGPYF